MANAADGRRGRIDAVTSGIAAGLISDHAACNRGLFDLSETRISEAEAAYPLVLAEVDGRPTTSDALASSTRPTLQLEAGRATRVVRSRSFGGGGRLVAGWLRDADGANRTCAMQVAEADALKILSQDTMSGKAINRAAPATGRSFKVCQLGRTRSNMHR